MVTSTKKVINFLSAGLRPAASKTRQTRPFSAVLGRPSRFEAAARHQTFKAISLRFKPPVLRFLLAPDGHLPTEHFWHFWAFLPQMTFLPPVEAVAMGCVLFPRGPIYPDPSGGARGP